MDRFEARERIVEDLRHSDCWNASTNIASRCRAVTAAVS
jgi:valyl-tRNA synthetase